MRWNLFVLLALLLSVSAASAPAPAAAAPPVIFNLGTLGGNSSWGLGLNNSGQVVGYSDTTNAHERHAFLYTGTPGSGGVMRDLGVLGEWAGFEFSTAWDVNAGGQVVGYSNVPSGIHAFRYSGTPGNGGSMVDLGTLGGNSLGHDINDSGQITGAGHLPLVPGAMDLSYHAFLYTSTPGGGVMHDLGTLSLFPEHRVGYGINHSGQVTGFSGDDDPQYVGSNAHAFLYTGTPGGGGVMHDLGVLGGTQSAGYDINDSGQVVGISTTPAATAFHAFLYTGTPGVDGVMHDLGTLGGSASWGNAINAAGQVAGRSDVIGSSLPHAFLYIGTPGIDGQMIDLDAWLDAIDPTKGTKWTLTETYDLNDHGLLTGVGEYNDGPGGLSDGTRAFLLDASPLLLEPPGLPGDYNNNGTVDAADYVAWRKNSGTQQGYNNWRANFGRTSGNGAGKSENAAIPEPATAFLGIAAMIVFFTFRQARITYVDDYLDFPLPSST